MKFKKGDYICCKTCGMDAMRIERVDGDSYWLNGKGLTQPFIQSSELIDENYINIKDIVDEIVG